MIRMAILRSLFRDPKWQDRSAQSYIYPHNDSNIDIEADHAGNPPEKPALAVARRTNGVEYFYEGGCCY